MHPITKPFSLSILFLLLLLLPTTQAQFDIGNENWSHTQVQEGSGICFGVGPSIESSGNGEFVFLHEKGCWTGDGSEAFRTTDLETFTSITTDTSIAEGQYKQVHYNPIDGEFYACISTSSQDDSFFMFWDEDGTPLHTGDSNALNIGPNPANHCGISHVTNTATNYNIMSCRYTTEGDVSDITQSIRTIRNYTTFVGFELPTDSNNTHRCALQNDVGSSVFGQLIMEERPHSTDQNLTRWVYYSPHQEAIRERECLWQRDEFNCDTVRQREVSPKPPGLITGYASAQNNGTIFYVTSTSPVATNPDTGDPDEVSRVIVRRSQWGAAFGSSQQVFRIQDVTSESFGFNHITQNPCIWSRENVVLLAYTAWDTENELFHIIAHASRDGGNSWTSGTVAKSQSNTEGTTLELSPHGNCITYDKSLNQVAIGYIVNNADESTIGGAWLAYTNITNLDVDAFLDTITLPDGTVSDGTTFFGAPLDPVVSSWNIPLSAVQWLVGLIVIMVLIAVVAYLGLIAIVIVIIMGIGWAFVLGMFPLWFLLITGLLLSLGVGVSIFGGRE